MTARTFHLASERQRQNACKAIWSAPQGWIARVCEDTRTDAQNRLLWPLIRDCREQIPGMAEFSPEDCKLRFMNALGMEMRFLPVLEGQGMFPIGYRSSKLSVEQFSGLLDLIQAYGARHGVEFSQ